MLGSRLDAKVYEQGVYFVNPDVLVTDYFTDFSETSGVIRLIGSVYVSSLTQPASVRNSTRDLWNNAKIPSLSSLAGTLNESPSAVKNIDGKPDSYFSLIGIPMANLSTRADVITQFEFEALNLDVDCTSNYNTTLDNFTSSLSGPLLNYTYPSDNVTVGWQQYLVDVTNGVANGEMQGGYASAFIYSYNNSVNDFLDEVSDSIEIFYGSFVEHTNTSDLAAVTTCSISPVRLAANAFCEGQLCNVTSLRNLPTNFTDDHRTSLINALLSGVLPGIADGDGSTPTGTTLFLESPTNVFVPSKTTFSLADLPLDIISSRMSLVLNAYYYASIHNYWVWTSDLDTAMQQYSLDNVVSVANATVIEPLGHIYVVYSVWFAIALITSLLLAGIAVANIALRRMTSIPDVFGYASSMTWHNEICRENGLARSSALDGLERAVELRDVKFRIADIRSDSDVGRMAFVPVSQGGGGQEHYGDVKLGRMYD